VVLAARRSATIESTAASALKTLPALAATTPKDATGTSIAAARDLARGRQPYHQATSAAATIACQTMATPAKRFAIAVSCATIASNGGTAGSSQLEPVVIATFSTPSRWFANSS